MDAASVPLRGVWCPAVTLFDPETDELLLDDQAAYYEYLSQSGLTGLVVLGTDAETFLLTKPERKALIQTARRAVGPEYPIMAGVSGHSTKQVLDYLFDAHAAGANYALVLPPGYFPNATTPAVIDAFFDEIALESPLPVVLYNFPGVCNGVDLGSATIERLAVRHKGKFVGVKLTCGSVAKITRLAARLPPTEFAIFGGQSDFLLGGLSVGSAGCIAAFANVAPGVLARIYRLYWEEKAPEALALHYKAALAEQSCKAGIASIKYAASLHSARKARIEGAEAKMRPRPPYVDVSEVVKDNVIAGTAEILAIESTIN